MKTKPRTFKDKNKLKVMFQFRTIGTPYKLLADMFDCDFSTIYHHCTVYGVKPVIHANITPNLAGIISHKRILYITDIPQDDERWYIDVNTGERINRGRNYKDYLK